MSTHFIEQAKPALDVVSVSAGVAAWLTLIPPIAGLLTIIWTGLRILEIFLGEGYIHKTLKSIFKRKGK